MEASPARHERLYWLLVAFLLPMLNWWIGLWGLVLARDVVPLLLAMPLLIGLESVIVTWRLKGPHPAPGHLGTLGLLLVTTLTWSFALTLAAFALQRHPFTF